MPSSVPPGVAGPELRAYLELIELYDQRGEANMRDRFLILAADAAFAAGQTQAAEQLLHRLVQLSPHHMFKAYRSFAEALKAEPVRTYLADLKQNYPPEMVRNLLESLRGRSTQPDPGTVNLTIPAAPVPVARGTAADETAVLPPPPAPSRRPSGAASPPPAAVPARPAPGQPAARAPVARPAPAAAPAAPAPAAPARPRPARAPVAPASPVPQSDEPEAAGGGWLATLLFLVVLLAGLALAGYTLARPFLTPG